MITKSLHCIGIILISLTGQVVAEAQESLDELDWILGVWVQESERETMEERWIRLNSTTFEGTGSSVSKSERGKITEESLLLVAMSGEIFYMAKVAHNEFPVPFRLTSLGPSHAIFENSNHDFPQKLTYTVRSENELTVEVSGESGKGFTIHFEKRK